MNDSGNICLSCGLCCDGTLIGFVQLERKEMLRLRTIMEIEEGNGEGFFLQPCENLGCSGCTIYSKRPNKCAEFECGLLNSIEQKKISFDSAIEVIELVKQLKSTILNQLMGLPFKLQSKSFYFKILELEKLLNKKADNITLRQDHKDLMLNIEQLDKLVVSKFRISLF